MKWFWTGLVLMLVGLALRRGLRLGRSATPRVAGLAPLSPDLEAIYRPICQEVETQAAILGISLNDAIGERDAGHPAIAWRLVRLSASEWDRLAEIILALLKVLGKHLPGAEVVIPVRSLPADSFKTRVMADHVRTYEFLHHLVFRSSLRFQMHLRVLRRATETLIAEIRRTYQHAERTQDHPSELWTQLDFYFHDLDLIAKKTLLAFRALLLCLPPVELADLAADLKIVVRRGVRSTGVPVKE